MSSSILEDVKKALGLAPDYDAFDADLILHINSVLSDLNQLGIGPDAGLEITGDTETWAALTADNALYNSVKSYMVLRVKMLFDPPSTGYVITAMEKMLEKAEWRINIAREEIVHPFVEEVDVSLDPDGGDMGEPTLVEETILDGGTA